MRTHRARQQSLLHLAPALLWWLCGIYVADTAQADARELPPVEAASGWQYRVATRDLPGVDNLALAADGSLYATQELRAGAGKVIRLFRGENKTIVSDLNRPDGLYLHRNYLYITEEVADGRILEFNLLTNQQRVLATLNHPEGIDMLPDGDLVISEDSINGRLLRVPRAGRNPVQIIIGGLSRPEGLVVQPNGAIVFAETVTGRVLSYKDGKIHVLVQDLDQPDQVERAPDGALWITEDARSARLLRLKDGKLDTILSGLLFPQGLAFGADGTIWLAEQGRQRILAVHRKIRH